MENMGMRYYKIIQGYEHERDVIIREDELEKAYGLFMLGGRWIFSGGPVDGKNIQTIVEDYHSTMSWNKEHKLDPLDYEDLARKGVDSKMKTALNTNKEKVLYLINSKQEHLIGKGVSIPALEKDNQFSGEVKTLASKLKIK